MTFLLHVLVGYKIAVFARAAKLGPWVYGVRHVTPGPPIMQWLLVTSEKQ